MNGERVKISAGIVLIAAFIYYFADVRVLLAAAIPAVVHELGHIVALKLFGFQIKGVSLDAKGFCISYRGFENNIREAAVAAAGPIAGLFFSLAFSHAGSRTNNEWLYLTSGFSLFISIFNLLPVLPLDGGRILFCLAGRSQEKTLPRQICVIIGAATCAAFAGFGTWLMITGRGCAALAAAIWLIICQNESAGLEKERKII